MWVFRSVDDTVHESYTRQRHTKSNSRSPQKTPRLKLALLRGLGSTWCRVGNCVRYWWRLCWFWRIVWRWSSSCWWRFARWICCWLRCHVGENGCHIRSDWFCCTVVLPRCCHGYGVWHARVSRSSCESRCCHGNTLWHGRVNSGDRGLFGHIGISRISKTLSGGHWCCTQSTVSIFCEK